MVRKELLDGKDELSAWIKARGDAGWFLEVSDEPTQEVFGQIAAAVQAGPYKEAAKAEFLATADPWLIAKAATTGATVVTHEVFSPEIKKKVPIPNICLQFGIKTANTFDTLRDLSATFIFDEVA
jgi:hypothetical protein